MASKFHLNPLAGKPPVARTDVLEAVFVYRLHNVLMTGVSVEDLDECLGKNTVVLQHLGDARVECVPAEFLPFEHLGKGYTAIPAGLVLRFEQHLLRRGYHTRHINKTCWDLLRDAWQRLQATTDLESFDRDQRTLFATVPRGRFEVQNFDQTAELIAAAARAHRGKVVHVIAKNRDAMETLARKVKARVPGRCWRCEQIDDFRRSELHCNIMISTPSYFATQFTMDAGLVILVDGEVASNRDILDYLLTLPEMLRYAIINRHWRSTSSDEMTLEALFGPVVYRLPDDGDETISTLVAWVTNKQPLKSPAGSLTLAGKRSLYWENIARNKLVANVANALAGEKCHQLKQLGLSDIAITLAVSTLSSDAKFAVLVESQAHAAEIHTLLPDWVVYTNSNVLADRKRKQTAVRAIVTEGFLAGAKPNVDVIIRATGAAAELSACQFISRRAKLSPPRLLIDVNDSFDCERVAKRREHYRNNNWQFLD